MRNLFLQTVILCLLVLSCTNQPGKSSEATGTAADNERNQCYMYTSGQDTIWLEIERKGEEVTGQLNYLFFEKDKSRGTIKGQLKGDTLIADYEFMSERIQSGREVMFLKQGNDFIEVYRGTLGYVHGTLLKQVPCD